MLSTQTLLAGSTKMIQLPKKLIALKMVLGCLQKEKFACMLVSNVSVVRTVILLLMPFLLT